MSLKVCEEVGDIDLKDLMIRLVQKKLTAEVSDNTELTHPRHSKNCKLQHNISFDMLILKKCLKKF